MPKESEFTKPVQTATTIWNEADVADDKDAVALIKPWMTAACLAKQFLKHYRDYKKAHGRVGKLASISGVADVVRFLEERSITYHPSLGSIAMDVRLHGELATEGSATFVRDALKACLPTSLLRRRIDISQTPV